MRCAPFPILYEDAHLLAINKPAGLPTMGVGSGRRSVIALLRQFLTSPKNEPGPCFLGVVSRLDTPVTGVLLLAKDRQTARKLNEQFHSRKPQKCYWALVDRPPHPASGQWCDWLTVSPRHRKVQAAPPDSPKAREAATEYHLVGPVGKWFLVVLYPKTGRKHQLRWQLAAHGCPVVGDRKYGSQHSFPAGIALHARSLEIIHPWEKKPIRIVAPLPAVWQRFGVSEELAPPIPDPRTQES
jgi:23S rRNA pseudouridine1911/1915/1917 synthase